MLSRRDFIQETAFKALAVWITERALAGVATASPETGLTFFTLPQAETIEAIAERIWPSTPGDPGAIEAGVVTYIDRMLSGFHHELKNTYRRGIDSINAYSQKKFGDTFANLSEKQHNEILTNMEKNSAEAQPFFMSPSASEFFGLIRNHTREGLFSDPVYGGNRNFIGWKSIGYPGPRFLYTAEMQTTFAPLELPMQSVADL